MTSKKLHTSLFSVDCNLRRLTLRIFIEVFLQYKGYSVYPKIYQSLLLSRMSPLLYLNSSNPFFSRVVWETRYNISKARFRRKIYSSLFPLPNLDPSSWLHICFGCAVCFLVCLLIYLFIFYLLTALHLPFLVKSSRY